MARKFTNKQFEALFSLLYRGDFCTFARLVFSETGTDFDLGEQLVYSDNQEKYVTKEMAVLYNKNRETLALFCEQFAKKLRENQIVGKYTKYSEKQR